MPDHSWWGWGDASQVPELPGAVLGLLRDGLGVSGQTAARVMPTIPASRLPGATAARLAAIVGDGNILTDDEARLAHTRGKSTVDLLRARAGDGADAPDLVVLPGSHEEVLELLRVCTQEGIAVVPFGGGTSVVGGLAPSAGAFAGVVALDLRRMSALVALDEVSRVAELGPGLRGPEAEALLAERGYTLGHFPQSFEFATLGGFAATRSSGQASAGYGRFDELVVALRLATPAGTLALGRAPKSASGPDLRQLVLGSEGTLGVITSLTVQVRPAPEARVYEGWRFPSFAAGMEAVRALAQDGPLPTVLRLSDEAETALGLAGELGAGSGGALCIAGWEGGEAECPRAAGGRARGDRAIRRRLRGGSGRAVAGGALPRAVPSRRAARGGSAGGDARDGDLLVGGAAALRGGERRGPRGARGAGHATDRPLPHIPRVRRRGLAVFHDRLRPRRRSRPSVASREGGRR